MRHRAWFPLLFSLLLGLAACESAPPGCGCPTCPCSSDAGSPRDVRAITDAAGGRDAPVIDAVDAPDGPLPGLGSLSGACGTLRAMLRSPAPSLVENTIAFAAGERYERAQLSPGAQRLYDTPNAGGSSTESEVFSYEVLRRCEGAALVATETEIMYAPPDDSGPSTISDILMSIAGDRVGVSVTRTYRPAPMVVTDAIIRELIVRKLVGINRSSMRVLPAHRWVKQILHVFAPDADNARRVAAVWATLDAATRADTIVLVTVTRGGGFLYCDPDPALGSECPPR